LLRAFERGREIPARARISRHPPALVRVYHDVELAPELGAHLLDHLDVLAPAGRVEPDLHRPEPRVPQRAAAPHALVAVDALAARGVREQALRAAAEQHAARDAERAADEIPDGDLDDPRPSAVERDGLADLADHLRPARVDADEESLELRAV